MGKGNQKKAKKDKTETAQQSKFNGVSNSTEVENQNQGHNSKKGALGPNTKR